MSFFDVLILDVILILFPIIVILILKAYSENIKGLEKKYFIDIANLVALFLLIKFGSYQNTYDIMLLNIPFVISILYRRKVTSVIIALVIISLYYVNGYNLDIKIIEYLIYLFIFSVINYRKKSYKFVISTFLFINGICITIEEFYLLSNNSFLTISKIFISLVVFYLVGILIMNIISLLEEVISLNQSLKELEKEKNLKNSLFQITHEVKNPIAVCKGYLSMMDYSDIHKVKKYNEIIESELNRTLDIMDNFSRYTKIKVDKDIMDLDFLINEVISNMTSVFESYKVNVFYDYEDEILISGDYNRLKQVFVNVLKNSCEAMESEGKIHIKVRKNNSSVILSIKDNGHGMTKEELENIDKLFSTTKDKGCGIGVPISKEIVRLHGGELKYKSALGKYTEVIIKLPLLKDFD